MSAKGCSPDNAACEGFFGRLKNEFFHYRDWEGVSLAEFSERLDAYLRYYCSGRIKRSLGWLSPDEYRRSEGWSGQDFLDNYLRIFRLLRALSRKEHCSQWRNASSVCCSRARCT